MTTKEKANTIARLRSGKHEEIMKMKGTIKIINYDERNSRINVEVISPYSAKTLKAWFENDMQICHTGRWAFLAWVDETIDYYISNEEFRSRLENTFNND